jgi:hypothetical protein
MIFIKWWCGEEEQSAPVRPVANHHPISVYGLGCFSPYRTLPLTIALLHKIAAIDSTGLMIAGAMLAAAIDLNINAGCMGVFANHGTMVCTRTNEAQAHFSLSCTLLQGPQTISHVS